MAGKVLVPGNSGLLAGPLGNVYIGFNGLNLGKTTEDTELTKDEDRKDILYSQDGTKASDHVSTGILMMLNCTFGKISTSLLKTLLYGFSSKASDDGTGDDSGTFGRSTFCSLREKNAKPLRIWANDCNGSPSEDDPDVLNAYEALPLVDENIINWGADTQRNLPVQFMIYYHEFDPAEIIDPDIPGAFAYYGDPAQEQVPATEWPDLAAPQISTAIATDATTIELTFDENIALQGGSYTGGIIVNVNGDYVAPSGVAVATNVATVTLPASSIANGDDVSISISDKVFQDTETTPNTYPGVDSYGVTNNVP